MLRDEVVNLVSTRFSGTRAQADRIILELQVAQNEYESKDPHPWWMVKRYNVTLNSTGYFTIPSDFLNEVEQDQGGALWVTPTDGSPLIQCERRPFEEWDACTGQPAYYDVVGDRLYYTPTPVADQDYAAEFVYYGRDATLLDNIENGWTREAPLLLVNAACVPICQYNGEDGRAANFSQLEVQAWQNLLRRVVQRREQNLTRIFGGR